MFSDVAEISYMYSNDENFRFALNAYVEGKSIDKEYLKKNTFLVNDIKNVDELTKAINDPNKKDSKNLTILFDYKIHDLSVSSKRELDIIVEYMIQNQDVKFMINGHTDSKASEAYNTKLSKNRVDEAKKYLLDKKIDKQRLKTKSYGESQPIAPNINLDGSDNEAGRALNRRVVFELIK